MKTLKQKLKINKQQFSVLKDYCNYSLQLYNSCIQVIDNYYEQTNKYLGYSQLYWETKNNENYNLLPAQCSSSILRLIDQNYRSYFALLRKKSLGQYNDKINKPKQKNKTNYFNTIFTYQNSRIKNNQIELAISHTNSKLKKTKKIKLDFNYQIDGIIKQIMIKPIGNLNHFEIYITYEENKKINEYNLNKKNYLGIDLGINNLCSCFNSNNGHSFLMNGKPLKSYNQWFNKILSNVKKELKTKNNKKTSKKIDKLWNNKKWFQDNYFNQIVNYIVKYCLKNSIGSIIIGYNREWKENSNMGKINNRQFYSISHLNLLQKLSNKCNEYGIQIISTEESYTSKCSFIDKEKLEHQETYLGKRSKRGLFISKEGKLINADINGAANIVRKVIGDAIYNDSQPIKGLIFNPEKINVLK